MSQNKAEIVICGAGIAGVSAAYHLSVRHGVRNVTLVDERAPLTLTSDKSTECYRNWWPGPGDAMVRFMNRSIDILEELARESDNLLRLNRRGYLYVTGDPARIPDLLHAGEEAASLGAGPLRCHPPRPASEGAVTLRRPGEAHASRAEASGAGGQPEPYRPAPAEGFETQPTGADLITDPALIRAHFPYLSEKTVAVLHARRCGYLSAQQYGMYMLERAREHGVRLVQARVTGIEVEGDRAAAVRLSTGDRIAAGAVVNAGGPFVQAVGKLMGVDVPVFSELHEKVIIRDDRNAAPRNTPLLIWIDRQFLSWSDEEREMLGESDETRWLLEELPSGVHGRSEGGPGSNYFLLQWTLDPSPVEPAFPLHFDPRYPELALRGLSTMIPGLATYFDRLPKSTMDGGYYTKTRENRPLIGPLPVRGAYVIGALSGFGVMASAAAGDLLAAHITGSPLPDYAPAFQLDRYDDPAYQKLLEHWEGAGQL